MRKNDQPGARLIAEPCIPINEKLELPEALATFSACHSLEQMDSKLCTWCAAIAPLITFLRCINLKLTNYSLSKGQKRHLILSKGIAKKDREIQGAFSSELSLNFNKTVNHHRRQRRRNIFALSVSLPLPVSLSLSLSLSASVPLGELIHFDGVEWPCKCWTRRKRRRCKLVASDQISRVYYCSLPHSLLPSFLPSSSVPRE